MFLQLVIFCKRRVSERVQKRIITSLVISVLLLVVGCAYNANQKGMDNLQSARDAISNQDYKLATHHIKLVLNQDPQNKEATLLSAYLSYGDDILLAAFWQNDLEAMQYIAPIVHNINREDSRFNAPVLVLAAAWKETNMVRILLENNADPNYGSDKDGYTALMWACKNFEEQIEMVRDLLDAGADIYATSNYNETALSIAQEYNNPNIVSLLVEYSEMSNQEKTE